MPHVLQSPESTPTTTSGSSSAPPSKPANNGGAPEGAPDVSDRVTSEEVVDENTDWDALAKPDEETAEEDTTPPAEETESTEDEETPPASSKPKDDKSKAQKPPADDQQKPPAKGPDETTDETDKAPPKDDQPPAPKQETEEQKTARLAKEAEAEKTAFEDLKKYYAVPEEMVERLRTEPELVLPEMAAKVHQAVFKGMQQWSTQMLPQMFAYHNQVQEANAKTKEAFFSRWPSLRGHDEQVLQVGRMFAQMNPKASAADRLEKVGKLACAALGIEPDPAPDGSGKSSTPPPAKRAAAKKKEGFRPSNPAGSSSSAPPPSDNVFTEMAEEMMEDDK